MPKTLRPKCALCKKNRVRVKNAVLPAELGHGNRGDLTGPDDLLVQRRDVYASLLDAIYDSADGDDFPMPRSGGWEYVIATLIIERDWNTINKTAADLREQEAERKQS